MAKRGADFEAKYIQNTEVKITGDASGFSKAFEEAVTSSLKRIEKQLDTSSKDWSKTVGENLSKVISKSVSDGIKDAFGTDNMKAITKAFADSVSDGISEGSKAKPRRRNSGASRPMSELEQYRSRLDEEEAKAAETYAKAIKELNYQENILYKARLQRAKRGKQVNLTTPQEPSGPIYNSYNRAKDAKRDAEIESSKYLYSNDNWNYRVYLKAYQDSISDKDYEEMLNETSDIAKSIKVLNEINEKIEKLKQLYSDRLEAKKKLKSVLGKFSAGAKIKDLDAKISQGEKDLDDLVHNQVINDNAVYQSIESVEGAESPWSAFKSWAKKQQAEEDKAVKEAEKLAEKRKKSASKVAKAVGKGALKLGVGTAKITGKSVAKIGKGVVSNALSAIGVDDDSINAIRRADKLVDEIKKLAIDLEKAHRDLDKANAEGDKFAKRQLDLKIEDLDSKIKRKQYQLDLAEDESGRVERAKKPKSKAVDAFLSEQNRQEEGRQEEYRKKIANELLEKRLNLQKQLNSLTAKKETVGGLTANELIKMDELFADIQERTSSIGRSLSYFYSSDEIDDLFAEFNAKSAKDLADKKNAYSTVAEAKDAEQAYNSTVKAVMELQRAINTLEKSMVKLDETEDKELISEIKSQLDEKNSNISALEQVLKDSDKESLEKLRQIGKEAVARESAKVKDASDTKVTSKYTNVLKSLDKGDDTVFKTNAIEKANKIMAEFSDGTIKATKAMFELDAVMDSFAQDNAQYQEKVKLVNELKKKIKDLGSARETVAKLDNKESRSPVDEENLTQAKQKVDDLNKSISDGMMDLLIYDKQFKTSLLSDVTAEYNLVDLITSRNVKAIEDTAAQKASEELKKTVEQIEAVYQQINTAVSNNLTSAFKDQTFDVATEVMERFKNNTLDAKSALQELNVISEVFSRNLEQEKHAKKAEAIYDDILKTQDKIDKLQKTETHIGENAAEISRLRDEVAALEKQFEDARGEIVKFDNQFKTNIAETLDANVAKKQEQFDQRIVRRDSDTENIEREKEIHEKGKKALDAYKDSYEDLLKVERELAKYRAENDITGKEDARLRDEHAKAVNREVEAMKALNNTGDLKSRKEALEFQKTRAAENEREIESIKAKAQAEAANKTQLEEQARLYAELKKQVDLYWKAMAQKERLSIRKDMTPDSEQFKQAVQQAEEAEKRMGQIRSEIATKGLVNEKAEEDIKRMGDSLSNVYDKAKAKATDYFNSLGEVVGANVADMNDAQKQMIDILNSSFEKVDITKAFDGNKIQANVKMADGAIKGVTLTWDKMNNVIRMTDTVVGKSNQGFSKLGTALSGFVNQIGRMVAGYMSINALFNAIKSGVGYVRDLDKALTELQLVTQTNDETISQFAASASKVAQELALTTEEVIRSQTEWARLGYDAKDALDLAAAAAKLATAGFMTTEESTSQLTSAIQAFYADDIRKGVITAGDAAMEISDKMVLVGNRFAITSQGIGQALQLASSAMLAAGNSLDETIALTTTANSIMQSPQQVANALKVVSMRLRGTDVKQISDEVGEEVDLVNTSFSKLYGTVKKLTAVRSNDFKGVSILTDTGQFKSTRQILSEIAEVYDEISDASQAALLEQLAGRFLPEYIEICA